MASSRMTFSVPERLKRRARRRRDINWSGVVAKAIEEKLSAIELADQIAARSRLTEEDVDELAEVVNRAIAKKLGVKA